MGIKESIRTTCKSFDEAFEGNRRESAIGIVERMLNNMADYVSAVVNMETALQVARFRMDGEEYRDHIETLDRRRKTAHDGMIASVSSCNRACDMAKCAKFFDGDIGDRYAVAEFAWKVVRELFDGRVGSKEKISIEEILSDMSNDGI